MATITAAEAAGVTFGAHFGEFAAKVDAEIRALAAAGYTSCGVGTAGRPSYAVDRVVELLLSRGFEVARGGDHIIVKWENTPN